MIQGTWFAVRCAVVIGVIIQKMISACKTRLITVSLKLIEHLGWFPIEAAGPHKLIMPTFIRRERRLMVLSSEKFGHSACLQDALVHLPSWITTYPGSCHTTYSRNNANSCRTRIACVIPANYVASCGQRSFSLSKRRWSWFFHLSICAINNGVASEYQEKIDLALRTKTEYYLL